MTSKVDSLSGEYRDDPLIQILYSTDASIYQVKPKGVFCPQSEQEIVSAIKFAKDHGSFIIPRGGGTGISGGCLGEGYIVDLSKGMNQILKIDPERKLATVQGGVVLQDLNHALLSYGLEFGPNTSTADRATIGGMIANNAAGESSLRYGQTGDHLEELKIAFGDGRVETLGPKTGGPLFDELIRLGQKYKQEIIKDFPRLKRRVSGYNLPALLPKPDLPKLFAGSEGTFGLVIEATLRLVPITEKKTLVLYEFSSVEEAMDGVDALLTYSPSALELVDEPILKGGKALYPQALQQFDKTPAALLAGEFLNPPGPSFCGATRMVTLSPEETKAFWALRKGGLGLLLSKRSYIRAVAFIEDIALTPAHLSSFYLKFKALMKREGLTLGIYGHVGDGCLHIRPYLDLFSERDRSKMTKIAKETLSLLIEEGGVMSGEHGDGLVRSWSNPLFFRPPLLQAMKELKTLFDPEGVMNPGKIIDGSSLTDNLKKTDHRILPPINTFLDFSKEGGFELSVDLCNGNGLCRKKTGTMCPSYQATLSEKDSTRGRADLLRGLINGELSSRSLAHPAVKEVLDLCLQCKGCKTECPSQVDMSKMKSEALYHQHKKFGTPLRDHLFGAISTFSRLQNDFPFLSSMIDLPFVKWGLEKIGITQERPFPKVASRSFSELFRSIPQKKKVFLFNDTFTQFHEPEIGQSTVSLLNRMGYEVHLLPYRCCGRPLISKGLLKKAKTWGDHLVQTLTPSIEEGIPIIGLEPSCLLTLKDDYPSLGLNPKWLSQCTTLDEFLAAHVSEIPFAPQSGEIYLHGHCHQKALLAI